MVPGEDLIARGKTLQVQGPYAWRKQTLELNDDSAKRQTYTGRTRKFLADLYIPSAEADGPRPVIVISHGFNSNRETYAYLAEHLASHGYAVAVPEHSGSNTAQLQALLEGRARNIIKPTEFLDRPLDVSFLLDALEMRSQTDPSIGPLNLEQVGIFGQSFGGYTALALGGASLTFNQLYEDCAQLRNTLNLSLLFQCQARLLIPKPYKLADPRIKAVVAVNSIGSSLLGADAYGEIEVPVMLVSGSSDTVAPALSEQIRPFSWLTTSNKYLFMMVGGNHFSTIGVPATDDQNSIGEILDLPLGGPAPDEARQDLKTLSLAFMNAFVTNQPQNLEYLTPGYVSTLSQPALPLALTQDLMLEEAATEE
ncbi:MAG: alpha/beta hydrolase [Cyanobacteria bacterium P01_A01_bin.17]